MSPDTVQGSELAPSGALRESEAREVASPGSDGAGRTLATYDLGVRYDRSLAAMEDHWSTRGADYYAVGIFRRPTRLFALGDVVFSAWTNGQAERFCFTGWSSKRRSPIRQHFVQFARWRWPEDEARGRQFYNRSPIALVTRPAALRKHSWRQPGLRRFALSALRAACPAFPVSTNSGSSPRVIEFRALIARWMVARRLAEEAPRPVFVHEFCPSLMRSPPQTSTAPFRCELCRLDAHPTTTGDLSEDEESWWTECADAIWHDLTPEERDEVDHL